MRLSKDFTLQELTVSDTAIKHGISNIPNQDQITNLILLCQFILQPIKEHFGKPVIINSGYRSPNHNKLAGGAPLSQHLFGKAIDLKIGDINRDGSINQEDKNIAYKILQLDVIANRGGLGFYPNTQILHMDVRGEYARWNNYKRIV
jgi:uncharacterized protein YcbK (DUF882 family)